MKLLVFLIKYYGRYLRYYWRARTRYDVHSPFVSAFLEQTLDDHRWYYIFSQLQTLREKLALNDDAVKIVDHGAGSQLGRQQHHTVRRIAHYSAITPIAGQLLFRIVNFLKPQRLLELGTSLGVSAIYQMAANRNAEMITIEGNPAVAKLAKQHFQEFGLPEVKVIVSTFNDTLPQLIIAGEQFDFFHFDGDHRYQPTIDYFQQCLELSHSNSVICIGDIYWSSEMKKAWNELRIHPKVRLSIDVFHFGLLFFRSQQIEKEDFTLIASWKKPWRMGFFN
ncbi:MAG: class I SAM-dependent methyltransferase [Saprospiraceae bacterium]